MKPIFRLLVLLFFVLFISNCATIVGERNQSVPIFSQPSGAQVEITDENGVEVFQGTTPTTVVLKKGDGYFDGNDFKVKLTKEGYPDKEVELNTTVSGWYAFGNLVFGGLVGYILVDPASGAMWTLDPEVVNTDLSKTTLEDEKEAEVPEVASETNEESGMY